MVFEDIFNDCDGTFGDIFGSIRAERGLTQEEVGATIGYGKAQISKWETDAALPPNYYPIRAFIEMAGCSKQERVRLERAYAYAVLKKRGL